MALQLGSLYDALIAANAPREKAQAAAEEAAQYETRFQAMIREIQEVKREQVVLRWMMGMQIALTLIVLSKLFIVP